MAELSHRVERSELHEMETKRHEEKHSRGEELLETVSKDLELVQAEKDVSRKVRRG